VTFLPDVLEVLSSSSRVFGVEMGAEDVSRDVVAQVELFKETLSKVDFKRPAACQLLQKQLTEWNELDRIDVLKPGADSPRADEYVAGMAEKSSSKHEIIGGSGLFLWSMNDVGLSYNAMSDDARKSIHVVASLIHGGEQGYCEDSKCDEFCEWLKKELGSLSEFDVVKMFEAGQKGTVWLRVVGRKRGDCCKGYVLDVTKEHSALLKAKQVEHYLRIMSRQAFDVVMHVDSKILKVLTVWDAKKMAAGGEIKEGQDLRELLCLNDAETREMVSAAMCSGSSLQTVIFGEARTPSQCLCIIEPDDPGLMIVAITSTEFRARNRSNRKGSMETQGTLKAKDLQLHSAHWLLQHELLQDELLPLRKRVSPR